MAVIPHTCSIGHGLSRPNKEYFMICSKEYYCQNKQLVTDSFCILLILILSTCQKVAIDK